MKIKKRQSTPRNTIKKTMTKYWMMCPWWRLVLVLVPPLVIFFGVILPADYYFVRVPGTDIFALKENDPGITTPIKNLIEVPFDLKWYTFCFKNINVTSEAYFSSKYSIILHDYDPNVTLEIYKEGTSELHDIQKGDSYCTNIKAQRPLQYIWRTNAIFELDDTDNLPINSSVKEDTKTTIRPEFWNTVTKLILTVIGWSGLILLAEGIIKFVVKNK